MSGKVFTPPAGSRIQFFGLTECVSSDGVNVRKSNKGYYTERKIANIERKVLEDELGGSEAWEKTSDRRFENRQGTQRWYIVEFKAFDILK